MEKIEHKLKREEFLLRIGGQTLGEHCVSIVCDKTFFDIAEMEDLHDGLLNIRIKMEVQEQMVLIDFHFSGYVLAPCDRCLDDVKVPMDFSERLVVKLVENPAAYANEDDEAENLWFVGEKEPTLDVFHFVYESILLALPMKIVHPDDENGNSTCNPEILDRLQKLSGKDEKTDPRWDALKDIEVKD